MGWEGVYTEPNLVERQDVVVVVVEAPLGSSRPTSCSWSGQKRREKKKEINNVRL